ncbi:hypothetical protein FGO68_gene5524 [Halteria grandinella]|uniref:Uncharacterized protein n=1 Tax=Halteria grandinella TaxID=5974 RepID=A0A8J8NEQ7_HALGN|nr:hypothetical protein FGO68_gene5524 [Halteria grandinella]
MFQSQMSSVDMQNSDYYKTSQPLNKSLMNQTLPKPHPKSMTTYSLKSSPDSLFENDTLEERKQTPLDQDFRESVSSFTLDVQNQGYHQKSRALKSHSFTPLDSIVLKKAQKTTPLKPTHLSLPSESSPDRGSTRTSAYLKIMRSSQAVIDINLKKEESPPRDIEDSSDEDFNENFKIVENEERLGATRELQHLPRKTQKSVLKLMQDGGESSPQSDEKAKQESKVFDIRQLLSVAGNEQDNAGRVTPDFSQSMLITNFPQNFSDIQQTKRETFGKEGENMQQIPQNIAPLRQSHTASKLQRSDYFGNEITLFK